MVISRWFRKPSRPIQSFRPTLLVLEDRTVPSGMGGGGFPFLPLPSAGTATHLQVVVPQNVQSGSSFSVVVEAEDASNHVATNYNGAVTLTLGTPDPGATLPATYTFASSDHGVHQFQVTLSAAGSETIMATGVTTSSSTTSTITGSATTTVKAAPVATQVVVVTPEQAAVGVPTSVLVKVQDASGHVLPNYTGTVTLTSSDTTATGTSARHTTAASLPITYTFTTSDHGQHSFEVTFNETAAATGTVTTVTAATSGTTSITGQGTLTVFPATAVTHFGIFASPLVGTGLATPFVIEALNASNQVVTGYTGTVAFTSSDTTATASATATSTPAAFATFSYTFSASDKGVHTFFITFGTTGQQSFTVTDSTANAASTINVQVNSKQHHIWSWSW